MVAAVIAVVAPPQEMGCGPYSSVPQPTASAAHASAGPVTVISFAELFEASRARRVYRPGGAFVLKFAVVVSGGRDVTLSVPPSVVGRLSIARASGDEEVFEGAAAVRYEACPKRGRATGYPGALLYSGPWKRCVPLTVAVEGRARALTMRLPLGAAVSLAVGWVRGLRPLCASGKRQRSCSTRAALRCT